MDLREFWALEPGITFLNHGSFGAVPRAILQKQSDYRAQMEAEPVRFMVRELEPLLDASRAALAAFVGASQDDLAFVPNATFGVNSVLRSLDLDKHDELLVTNHEYNASRNVIEFAAAMSGAKVVVVDIPFPIDGPDAVVARVLERVTERTRLLLIDHITSQTALIFPVERIVAELHARGIDTLVDGAHAPGMIPLDLTALGAAYYTANLHKWVCAPKGAAFLFVRRNRRASVRPAVISHGANATRTDRSRFHLEFDWIGTTDPTPWLCVNDVLDFLPSLVDGGWPEIMRRNHELVLRGRDILCAALNIPPPARDEMLGSMATVPLPGRGGESLHDALLDRFSIEVPVMPWPTPLLRLSAQLYNTVDDYERLAVALRALL